MVAGDVQVELRPRRVEAELKIWFEKWLRRAHRTHNYQLDDMAKEAIRHIASRLHRREG